MIRRAFVICLLAQVTVVATAQAGSEKPPPGPDWKRDFHHAQQEALRSGKPLFLYFTKTY